MRGSMPRCCGQCRIDAMKEGKIVSGGNAGLGLGRRRISRGESAGRRATGRDSMFLMASIRRAGQVDDELEPGRIRNLSPVGLMADYRGLAEPGDRVTVSVRGLGDVEGLVAWVRDERIGVVFDALIDPMLARKPL
jgi:hypothetical protein